MSMLLLAGKRVAEAVLHALFDENPKPRYLVVPGQEQAEWTIYRAIERLVVQNNDQKYSYDREALIEMFDKAMARPTPKSGQESCDLLSWIWPKGAMSGS
jgi:hypothetical protein